MTILTPDIGWLCISRFILLDAMLLFFTFTTALGVAKFHNQRHEYVTPLSALTLVRSLTTGGSGLYSLDGPSAAC